MTLYRRLIRCGVSDDKNSQRVSTYFELLKKKRLLMLHRTKKIHFGRIVLILSTIFVGFVGVNIRRQSERKVFTISEFKFWRKSLQKHNETLRRIPRLIHQTWKDFSPPAHWEKASKTVRELNAAEFHYIYWTDEDIDNFVREKEEEFYWKTYRNYPFHIQRVDAFRYVALFHLGGIYIDMDNGCRQSLSELIRLLELIDPNSENLSAFPQTVPVGISNGFMISTAKNPFFRRLIDNLEPFRLNFIVHYLTVMMTAGPLFLTIQEFFFDQTLTNSSIRLIDDIVYSDIFTWHTTGNSWHGSDAKFILFFYEKILKNNGKRIFLFFSLFFILIFLKTIFKTSRRFSIRR